jgi:hypothetical protein
MWKVYNPVRSSELLVLRLQSLYKQEYTFPQNNIEEKKFARAYFVYGLQ